MGARAESNPAEDSEFVSWWREEWSRIEADITLTLGIEAVSASDGHVELAMPFRPEISQVMGFFAAGSLIQLADNAAATLCLRTAKRRGYEGFPFTVQMSAQLVGNAGGGRALARSTLISAGRSLMAAETRVADESGRLLVLVTSVHALKLSEAIRSS